MTIEQAIEYATSGQSSGGPITQDALSVLAGAAQDRQRLLDACERLVKADSNYWDSVRDYVHGRVGSNSAMSADRDRASALGDVITIVKFMGGLAE